MAPPGSHICNQNKLNLLVAKFATNAMKVAPPGNHIYNQCNKLELMHAAPPAASALTATNENPIPGSVVLFQCNVLKPIPSNFGHSNAHCILIQKELIPNHPPTTGWKFNNKNLQTTEHLGR